MKEPKAWVNGHFVPMREAAVPVWDAGFVLGATVSEQLRTFNGRLFRWDAHAARLKRGLELAGIKLAARPGERNAPLAELANAAERLVEMNHPLLSEGSDLGVCVFCTPGNYATLAPVDAPAGPRMCMHTYPLPFRNWAAAYETGVSLATTDVVQVPPESWPPEIKCRSRMHYYLADQAAAALWPDAKALLCDAAGHVRETATANIVVYRTGEGLVSPPLEAILPGVSLDYLRVLADRLGLLWTERELTVDEIAAADEVLLTSTPSALLSVTQLNGEPIGLSRTGDRGRPGKVFARLLRAWSETVGCDIVLQARKFGPK